MRTIAKVGSVILSTVLLSSAAKAATIPLVYESGPLKGQAFTGGPLIFQLTTYQADTQYNAAYPVGTNLGYTGSPSSAGYQSGISTLQSQPGRIQATGTQGLGSYNSADGNMEDGWGIVQVNNIEDKYGTSLFTPGATGLQLTAIFYGQQDFYLNQSTPNVQLIDSVGMQADFYLSNNQNFNPSLGTTARTANNVYAGVTDGSLVMHIQSVPGFIDAPGSLGGLATEVQTSVDSANASGTGEAFADVTSGSEAALLDSGTFTSAFTGATADIQFNYTDKSTDIADWSTSANDPILAVSVPEPTGLGFAAVTVAGLLGRRRNRR